MMYYEREEVYPLMREQSISRASQEAGSVLQNLWNQCAA